MQKNLRSLIKVDNSELDGNMIIDWGSDTIDIGPAIVTGVEAEIDGHALILDNNWSLIMANARLRG